MPIYPSRSQIDQNRSVEIEFDLEGKSMRVPGTVSHFLDSEEYHPDGIKVMLFSGHKGRVKKFLVPNKDKIFEMVDLDKKSIPKMEDQVNEFKEYFQYDENMDNPSSLNKKDLDNARNGMMLRSQMRVAITICSFANSQTDGFLYLGIRSNGTISGLEKDLKMNGFKNYDDEFANHIRNVLGKFLDDKVFIVSRIRLKFRKIENKTICIIHIFPATQPLYLNDGKEPIFYVRGTTPRAEKFTGNDLVRYILDRFPNFK